MLADSSLASGTRLECFHGEGMASMQPRAVMLPGGWPQVGPLQKRQERTLNIYITERSAVVVDKDMTIRSAGLPASKKVPAQPRDGRVVQEHETCLPELRLADQ